MLRRSLFAQRGENVVAVFEAAQEHDDAGFGLGQCLLGLIKRKRVAAAGWVEKVEDRERFVDANEGFLVRVNVTFGQRQMNLVRSQVGVGVQGEFAVCRWKKNVRPELRCGCGSG